MIKHLAATLLPFIFMYWVLAFINWSAAADSWSQDNRIAVVFIGSALSIIANTLLYYYNKERNDKYKSNRLS